MSNIRQFTPDEDAPLLLSWHRGDLSAFETLVWKYQKRIFNLAILLTGDISAEIERAVVPLLTPARIRVLKVAHHGSRTSSSSALLESWRPQFAVISCGRGNRFGHPTLEVLQRLEAIGATILRTDLEGQIELETDGRLVIQRTFARRSAAGGH